MKTLITFLFYPIFLMSQHYVDLSDELSSVDRGMIINGNDYVIGEQVIINTKSINFKKPVYILVYNALLNVKTEIKGGGKIKLENFSMMYVGSNGTSVSANNLMSNKPFGEEIKLDRCKLLKKYPTGTPYTLWNLNGKKVISGKTGDGGLAKRMFYNLKIKNKFLDKQFLTD